MNNFQYSQYRVRGEMAVSTANVRDVSLLFIYWLVSWEIVRPTVHNICRLRFKLSLFLYRNIGCPKKTLSSNHIYLVKHVYKENSILNVIFLKYCEICIPYNIAKLFLTLMFTQWCKPFFPIDFLSLQWNSKVWSRTRSSDTSYVLMPTWFTVNLWRWNSSYYCGSYFFSRIAL